LPRVLDMSKCTVSDIHIGHASQSARGKLFDTCTVSVHVSNCTWQNPRFFVVIDVTISNIIVTVVKK